MGGWKREGGRKEDSRDRKCPFKGQTALRCAGPGPPPVDRAGDNTHLLKGNVHCRTWHAWTPAFLILLHQSKENNLHIGKYILQVVRHFLPSRPDENYRVATAVPKRVPRATNGGNLSPTALRVLLAARPFFHPSAVKVEF